MKYFAQFVIFSSFLLFLFSCDNDDAGPSSCIENPDLGDFFLLDSSKDFVPYGDEELVLIFSDSLGNEYKGNYIPGAFEACEVLSAYNIGQSGSNGCPISFSRECQMSRIVFEDFGGLEIQMFLSMDVSYSVEAEEAIFRDFINITIFEGDPENPGSIQSNQSGGFLITIDSRTDDRAIVLLIAADFQPMFGLHDEIYENVYLEADLGSDVVEIFDLYFSQEVGLVGFENIDKSISLKFERIE